MVEICHEPDTPFIQRTGTPVVAAVIVVEMAVVACSVVAAAVVVVAMAVVACPVIAAAVVVGTAVVAVG